MKDIIYFDNAATTCPKPVSVIELLNSAVLYSSGNPGRGSHILSSRASDLVYGTRETAARFFNAQPGNVVFTLNATHALNYAIKGLARRGTHILIDNYAHNASYRPALALERCGFCTLDVYDASGTDEETAENVRSLMRRPHTIVISTHQSNICPKVLPIRKIGEICSAAGADFIVDASQSAGHIAVDLEADHITSLCVPAHKGLYGIMGAGMLISAPTAHYKTLIEGGAGIASLEKTMPEMLPERLEAGTLALPAVAALKSGIDFVVRTGIGRIHSHETMLSSRFCGGIKNIPGAIIHGESDGPVVSITVDGHTPAETGEYLNDHGICVRTGYHCAPLAHKTLGTLENGTVRFSFSCFNTVNEVNRALEVLESLCRAK